MSIIRIERMSQPYTMIANCTLQDKLLSLEAKGLLVYLLSKPDDWRVMSTVLMHEFRIGKTRFYRIMDQLEELGYMTRESGNDHRGYRTVEYVIYETPWNVELVPKTSVPKTASGLSASGLSASGQRETTKNRLNKEQIYTKEELNKVSDFQETDSMRDAKELTLILSEKVKANGFKAVESVKSVKAMERLLRIDGRTYSEVLMVINWCQTDEFWLSNIRSTEKLRDKFDTLLGQMMRGKRGVQKFLSSEEEYKW